MLLIVYYLFRLKSFKRRLTSILMLNKEYRIVMTTYKTVFKLLLIKTLNTFCLVLKENGEIDNLANIIEDQKVAEALLKEVKEFLENLESENI